MTTKTYWTKVLAGATAMLLAVTLVAMGQVLKITDLSDPDNPVVTTAGEERMGGRTGLSFWDAASGTYRLVGTDYPLPMDAVVELGDVTIESIPSYIDSLGTPTRALVDTEDRVLVNIGSETIGLKDAIEASTGAITGIAAVGRTLTVTTGAAVSVGDLGDARVVYVYSDEDVNFGGSGVASGSAAPFIPGGAPFVSFRFTNSTPDFYFIGRSEEATVQIWEAN